MTDSANEKAALDAFTGSYAIKFEAVRFNQYFSVNVDARTSPPTVVYVATGSNSGDGQSKIIFTLSQYYNPKFSVNDPTPGEGGTIFLNKDDYVYIIGTIAHVIRKQ
jgi:hypothetical protein